MEEFLISELMSQLIQSFVDNRESNRDHKSLPS